MLERVSDIAAFVFENGTLADDLLFGESEVPGLTLEEIQAIDRVRDHLEATWVGILTSCREHLWKLAKDHPCSETMRETVTRAATMFEKEAVTMPLVVGRSWEASCAFALQSHPDRPDFRLVASCWTQARHRDRARSAVPEIENLQFTDCHWLLLPRLSEGRQFDDIGAQAAEALWTFAKPIAEVVASSKTSQGVGGAE